MNIIEGNIETCKTCGTIYNYNDKDLKYIAGVYPCITCPKCGQQVVYVVENKIAPMKPIIEVSND
jgi:hypothetical protein